MQVSSIPISTNQKPLGSQVRRYQVVTNFHVACEINQVPSFVVIETWQEQFLLLRLEFARFPPCTGTYHVLYEQWKVKRVWQSKHHIRARLISWFLVRNGTPFRRKRAKYGLRVIMIKLSAFRKAGNIFSCITVARLSCANQQRSFFRYQPPTYVSLKICTFQNST